MRYAQVSDGLVVLIHILNEETDGNDPDKGVEFLAQLWNADFVQTDDAGEGYTWDGKQFVMPPLEAGNATE